MRVLVTGGRNWSDYVTLYSVMDDVHELRGPIAHIIVGGARGADYWAESWAWMELGDSGFTVFRADWKTHGLAAGPLRNQRMIDEGRPDLVVAFPGSRGTADMVRRATIAGIEVLKAETVMSGPGWETAA